MKFITKLRNRLKKITSILPNSKPDSETVRLVIHKDSDKMQVPDPGKEGERSDKPKREVDSSKTEVEIQNVRNLAVVSPPMVPLKINSQGK